MLHAQRLPSTQTQLLVRLITIALTALLLLIQYPLWLGQGGLLKVADLRDRVEEQAQRTAALARRNAKLSAEVENLRAGRESVEERARVDMGMIGGDEIYVQVVDRSSVAVASETTPP